MQIKVLAVGPSDIEDLVLDVGREFPELEINYVTYTSKDEVLNIVKHHVRNYEILLFAGSLPHNIAKKQLRNNIPMVYIQFEGTALYRVLFQLVQELNIDLSKRAINVSIDNLQKLEVEECLVELNIHADKLFFYESNMQQDIDLTTEFHHELWQNKQIDVAITCVGSIYERLKTTGVPAFRIIPTRSSVRSSLSQVLMEGKNLRQLDSQIAVGIINLSNMYEDDYLSEYQLQRRILNLQQILINYGEESGSIIKGPDRKEVKFISTRGSIQFEKRQSKEMNLLKEIFNKTQIKASMGIGIGRTVTEAEVQARQALTKASENQPSCFVMDIDGTVYGPIGNERQLRYSIRSDNQKILDMAKETNISSSTINRILSFCDIHGKNSVTTIDLANGLGITTRSARRILSKLEQASLAVITGEEQPIHRGRPRQVYSLFS
ncbi:helix-turn-helix domain-containing protein [Oceanobacillus damuensis]|uniref:transcriptional regulator n=1 Tax=Oceanobacillus damuensis TaxID=937928 RepID=UPI00082C55C5|nr:transcriptional regulator [Oceanobacillus damuensis]